MCASSEKVDKTIIKDACGFALPGELFALLGSSGAGKTTLMDVLACRKTTGKTTGKITINGHELDKKAFKYISAYAMQADVFIGTLTPHETLLLACKLLSPRLTEEEARQRVSAVLADLALDHVADSRIGTEFTRGLSGGERKRLSIAVQLIADPLILFLDEPTTGLVSDCAGLRATEAVLM